MYQACANSPLLTAGKEESDGRSTATSESTEATEEAEEQSSLVDRLSSFQKLVFIKAFREEKVNVFFVCVAEKKSNPEIVETFYCSLLSRLWTAKFETHLK